MYVIVFSALGCHVLTSHCLIATHLSLTNLREKSYGIYRRLALLTQSASAAGVKLRIFCVEPRAAMATAPHSLSQGIRAEIRELWGIDCEIMIGRTNVPSRLPWLAQQMTGALSYRWQWLSRQLLDPASRQRLREEIDKRPAFIIAHRLPMMSELGPVTPRNVPIFFDLDDIEHLAILRGVPQLNSLRSKIFALLSVPALLLAEAAAIARAQRTFVCSKIDADRAAKSFHSKKIFVLPNAVEMPHAPDTTPTTSVLLMLGIYSYGPNQDGADYFISRIFPLIRARHPQAQAWFVGGAPEHLRSYRAGVEGVNFLGFVDNLAEVYTKARVVICPIRQGSGTRVKLVEAAAWAKPIVSTTLGAEGLNMVDGTHALFGDDPQVFAERCLTLLADDALCAKLGRNARVLAERTYDKQAIIKTLATEFQLA